MPRTLKELYFTAFTIFFRTAGAAWSSGINAGKGVTGLALVESAFLVGVASWIDMLTGTKNLLDFFSKWGIRVAFFILCFINYYVLIACGHGVEFESEFSHLKKSKKAILIASSVTIMLAAIVFFVYSAIAHRHFIGVDKP